MKKNKSESLTLPIENDEPIEDKIAYEVILSNSAYIIFKGNNGNNIWIPNINNLILKPGDSVWL